MWRVLRTAGSAIVALLGVLLLLPLKALDYLGRFLTLLGLPDTFNQLIDWLAAHPRLAFDLGPWLLIALGLASLGLIHWQLIRRWLNREENVTHPTTQLVPEHGVPPAAPVFVVSITGIDVVGSSGADVISFVVAAQVEASTELIQPRDWRFTVQAPNGASEEVRPTPVSMYISFGLERGKNLQLSPSDFIVGSDPPSYVKGKIAGRILFKATKLSYHQARDRSTIIQLSAIFDGQPVRSAAIPVGDLTPEWEPPTLFELFQTDFSHVMKFSREVTISAKNDSWSAVIHYNEYLDFSSNTKFISIHIPPFHNIEQEHTFDICVGLLASYGDIINSTGVGVSMAGTGNANIMESQQLKFSGRVYIYYNSMLNLQQLAALDALYCQAGLALQLRGAEYLAAHLRNASTEHR